MHKLKIIVGMFLVGSLFSFSNLAAVMPQLVEIPADNDKKLSAADKDKEVTVLVDSEQLKLATITLRRGTVLPSHSTPVPATIQVLEGKGVIHVSGEPLNVTQGSIVVLAAGQEHDVVPEKASQMKLLVHYLRTAKHAEKDTAKHDH